MRRTVNVLIALAVVACTPMTVLGQSLREVIDREIEMHAGGALSLPCDDASFMRRVYLDLVGQIPVADEVRQFLADEDPAKREKLVDRLLASDDYPRRMQEFLTAMLLERRTDATVPNPEWEEYVRLSIADNRPWNELVAELLFSEPREDKQPQPPEKFFLVSGRTDMHQKTRDVARLLLGRDIMCSQCHDHPTVADYTQADYFGLFTFLQETPDKAIAEFESVFVAGKKTTGPRLPGGDAIEIPTLEQGQEEESHKFRPRLLLSAALPKADNQLFKRNSANRFWYLMMGRGLVHPLDLHHEKNPPSHPELLDALADSFAESGFDIKQLLREIALSNSYQRSSQLPDDTGENAVAPTTYLASIPKPLTPEQMAWAVMQATGNLPTLLAAPAPEKSDFTYNDYINGRIAKMPDNFADAMSLFVGVFSNAPGEPEVEFNPALGHSLFLMNEPLILDWLKPKPGNLVERLTKLDENERLAEELYLNVLTRLPTEEEQVEVNEYLQRFQNRRAEALGELAWALIASAEFRLNH
ncbi:MAG: DUF1553 domain-containing protein [Planctomycetota bacterium]|nr:DUF1553 domain-containing protein [Planctomycetota bacterium]